MENKPLLNERPILFTRATYLVLFSLLLAAGGILAWLYLPSANANEDQANIQIRLANFSGYATGDSAGSFILDGLNLANLGYGYSTSMFEYVQDDDNQTIISFVQHGNEAPAATISTRLEEGKQYTIIAAGDGVDVPISLYLVEDDLTPSETGGPNVRYGHLASISDPAGSLVDFYIENEFGQLVGDPIVNNIAYGGIQTRYQTATAGELDLQITGPNDQSLIVNPDKFNIDDGSIYSIYFIGDDINQPLQMVYFVDGDFGRIVPSSGPMLETSTIQVAHFASYTSEEGQVDISLNGVNYVTDFQYGWATDRLTKYALKPSGLYNVTLTESGDTISLASSNTTFEPDRTYTIVAGGNDVEQPLQMFSFEEETSAPANGNIRLRVINLVPSSSNLSETAIDFVDDAGQLLSPAFDNVQFGEARTAEISNGLLELQFTSADGSIVLFDPIDLTTFNGDLITIFAIGDGVRKPIQGYALTNGDFGKFLEAEEIDSGEETGFFSIAQLAPITAAFEAGVSISLGETVLIADGKYGSSAPYREFPAGSYPLTVTSISDQSIVLQGSVDIRPGQYATGVIIGNGETQPLELLVVEDDLTTPTGAKIRFGHVAPFAAVDADSLVDIQLEDGTTLVNDVPYRAVTGFEFQVGAGEVDIKIVDQAGRTVIDPRPFSVAAGDILTLFATGDAQLSDLGMYALFADQAGFFLPLAQSKLYIAHLAPFADEVNDTAVDIKLDGNLLVADFFYGNSISIPGITPGNHTVDVIISGQDIPILTEEITIAPLEEYTMFISGDGVNQPNEVYTLLDDSSLPPTGQGKIRFGHLAPFAEGRLSTLVDVRFQDGTLLVDDYQYGQFDQDYGIELEAGSYDLIITSSDGSTVLIDPQPFSLGDQDVLTLVATGDNGNQPLGLYNIRNGGAGEFIPLELENAELYVAHLAPFSTDIDTTRVSISVDGVNLLINFGYGDSTDEYIDILPGQHEIEIIPNDPTYPTVRKTINLVGGRDYTMVFGGDESKQPLDLLLFEDDNEQPLIGEARVRLGHLSPFGIGSAARIDVLDKLGEVLYDDAEYGMVESDYSIFKEGALDLVVTTPNGNSTLIDPIPVNLNAGDIVSLWPVGDGINQPLGFYAIRNGGPGEFVPVENVTAVTNVPQLNVVHLAPLIKGDAAVEIRVDGIVISPTFKYGDSTGYFGTTEGVHLVEVVATGTDVVIMSRSINVRAGRYYTVFAIGDGEKQQLELVAYEHPNLKSLDDSRVQINALNLAPFSARISSIVADVNTQVGDTIFDQLLYKIPQQNFFESGVYNLIITSGDGSVVLTDPMPIELRKGDFVNLIVTGDGADQNQEMQLYAIVNGGKGYFVGTLSSINAPVQQYLPITALDRELNR